MEVFLSPTLFRIFILIIGIKNVNTKFHVPITYIFMDVSRSAAPEKSLQVCANFYPNSPRSRGALPPSRTLEDAEKYQLVYDVNNVCGNSSLFGDIVFTYLYNERPSTSNYDDCSGQNLININERILRLESRNASAVLFYTTPYETHATFYDPRVNNSIISLPIYYINEQTRRKVQAFLNDSTSANYFLRFFVPKDPLIDAAVVIILCIALTCISIGGAWSGRKHYELYLNEICKKSSGPSHSRTQSSDHRVLTTEGAPVNEITDKGASTESGTGSAEPSSTPFNCFSLFLFIGIIVGFLLALYYFYNTMVWFIIVVYVIASSCAMCECLWYFVQQIPFGRCSFHLDPLADMLGKICRCCQWQSLRVRREYRHVALYLFCAAFAITWCVFRHWSYSFVLHDILAIFFSIVTIRNLRMPSLQWVTLLLSILLIYDLFMVFITPYLTPTGCSVMIDVATGGACSQSGDVPDATHNYPPSSAPQREDLPIVVRVPRFNDPLWSCYRMDVDLQYPPVILGLGDIILPGLLVGYNAAFSLASRTPYRLYYVIAVVGYFFGMIATFAALLLSQLPQPALIYLVPFTLVPTHIAALSRKEWKKMWKGEFPLIEESCPILNHDGSENSVTRQSETLPRPDNHAAVSVNIENAATM